MAKNSEVIAIYSRKSRFTGKGESIGNQVELCRTYIRTAFGDTAADTAVVFEDEGFSGGNLNRPDFKRMMKAARSHSFKAVVVYRLDRISRNISDFSALIEELGRLGIGFVSIRENFDTSSPMGRAMMYIASVFSQLERETIAERIRDNMHELAKTGRWLGGTTPTGYTSEAVESVTVDGKRKRACRLKLIPGEASIVRKIYELYQETGSLTTTEAELLRQQIKTKTGRNFTRFSIKGILQNPVYLIADGDACQYFLEKQAYLFSGPEEFDGTRGILAYNRTDQEKGRATIYLPTSQWIVSVGQHPGIIPARTWIHVQESLERNKSKAYRRPRSNEALLTGLLWCRCGSRMYPKLSGRFTKEGKAVYTYVCKMKEHSQRSLCSCCNPGGNLLDAAVVEEIQCLWEDGGSFLEQLEKSHRLWAGSRGEDDRGLKEIRRQQVELQRRIEALVDSLANFGGSTAAVHVKERIEELHTQNAQLQSRIRELEESDAQHTLSRIELDHMRKLLAVFRDCVGEMTVEQKRTAIRTVVRKIIWDGQYAHVMLFGLEEDEMGWQDAAGPEPVPNAKAGSSEGEKGAWRPERFAGANRREISGSAAFPARNGPSKTPWGEDSK